MINYIRSLFGSPKNEAIEEKQKPLYKIETSQEVVTVPIDVWKVVHSEGEAFFESPINRHRYAGFLDVYTGTVSRIQQSPENIYFYSEDRAEVEEPVFGGPLDVNYRTGEFVRINDELILNRNQIKRIEKVGSKTVEITLCKSKVVMIDGAA